MDKLKCDWCRAFYKESGKYPHTCAFCGGPEPEPPKPIPVTQTFFYKDWVVVYVQDWSRNMWCFRFYAGMELQGEVEISQEDMMNHVGLGMDMMGYVESRLEEKGLTIPSVVWERIESKRVNQWRS